MATAGTTKTRQRRTSDERREHVIAAAVSEFARHGYHGASTGSIAKRAGISQPYIYALFPSKRDLFLAANKQVTDNIRRHFLKAAHGASDPSERMRRMGQSYRELMADREEILFQLQSYAAGLDPAIQQEVRRCFTDLFDEVARMSGATRTEVSQFMSAGMLLNVVAALDLPEEYEPAKPDES